MLLQNQSLFNLNTLRLNSIAKHFINLNSLQDLFKISDIIKVKSEKFNYYNYFILGGGSNIILPKIYNGLVIHNRLLGIEQISETVHKVEVKVMSGEIWDDFVQYSINNNWFGLENLSLIPGTVGAAPIQNIGAYGVEVKDVIKYVEVYDVETKKFSFLSNDDCKFSYRNSIFKSNDKLIVVSVIFNLLKIPCYNLDYIELKNHFNGSANPTAQMIRDFVIKVRNSKLPDPRLLANVGSFFHNPILDHKTINKLIKLYPELPTYPLDNNVCKVSAGWLIDKLGLKGYRQGNVGIYDKQALVIINYGSANQNEILEFADLIINKVFQAYGITLNIEPIIFHGGVMDSTTYLDKIRNET